MAKAKPKAKKSEKMSLRFFMTTYVLGLYGGLVSGLVISLGTEKPPTWELWTVSIILCAFGIAIFLVMKKLFTREDN